MPIRAYTLLTALALAVHVSAHGYVALVGIDGALYAGNSPMRNETTSPIRTITANGPVQDVSSPDLACGLGAETGAAGGGELEVNTMPGSNVTFAWVSGSGGPWPHNVGPILTYMALCPSDTCLGFNATLGEWFKIAEVGANANGTGWVQAVFTEGGNYTVQTPQDLAPGAYLIRNELVALQNAMAPGGAEFYPSCTQLRVVGNGTLGPAANATVGFPGAYNASDPGILVNVYDSPDAAMSYSFPGPSVATLVPEVSGTNAMAQNASQTEADSAPLLGTPAPPPQQEIMPGQAQDMSVLVVPGQGTYLQPRDSLRLDWRSGTTEHKRSAEL